MHDRIRFLYNRIKEHLWVKPLVICIISIIIAFIAKLADQVQFLEAVPEVSVKSLDVLLSITSGSMLGVATFAVGSMLTAYSSASNTATPRSFPLVISDDVSQNALSSFIGAFIFSIVAVVALENGYYGPAGRFFLFIMSIVVFAIIILNFIRWLDRIARLGRLGNIIDKAEAATKESLTWRKQHPTMGAMKGVKHPVGKPVYGNSIGYLQFIDVPALQKIAEENDLKIHVSSLPGKFITPDHPLAFIEIMNDAHKKQLDTLEIPDTFKIDDDRTFDEDPRFGLIILSEIGSRALSTAVNDPGTAIDIIESFIRIFSLWVKDNKNKTQPELIADRVFIPELSIKDMFDDAFNPISRDGAGTIEVVLWLQKAFKVLASFGDQEMRNEAVAHANLAYRYAEKALILSEELEALKEVHEYFSLD
jgi:uncharacterized membrane protein